MKTIRRFLRRLLRWTIITLVVLAVILLIAGSGIYYWYTHRPQPEAITDQSLFQGITYTRDIRDDPRPMIIHVVEIDLTAPGIRFLVTPADGLGEYTYAARTTSQFLEEFGVQVAINGYFFDPWYANTPWDYYPHVGDGVSTRGLTASLGNFITNGYSPFYQTIYISQANQVTFNQNGGEIYNALSGHLMVLENGQHRRRRGDEDYLRQHHPRTAIALNQGGDKMLLVVIDGRQPNYSEGATMEELAAVHQLWWSREQTESRSSWDLLSIPTSPFGNVRLPII
jgi:hypothetical protein